MESIASSLLPTVWFRPCCWWGRRRCTCLHLWLSSVLLHLSEDQPIVLVELRQDISSLPNEHSCRLIISFCSLVLAVLLGALDLSLLQLKPELLNMRNDLS